MKRPMAMTMTIIAMTMSMKHCDRVHLVAMLKTDLHYCPILRRLLLQHTVHQVTARVTVLNTCDKVVLRLRRCVYLSHA